MNTTQQSQIYEILHQRRRVIAQAWYELLDRLSPKTLEEAELSPRLLDFTDQLIEALTVEDFVPASVRPMGQALVAVENYQPGDLVRIQSFLMGELRTDLSESQLVSIYPRLVKVLGEIAVGFFLAKDDVARRFNMDAMSKMGHDLKTPINAITGFSRVILKGIDGPITEFQQQDLTSIYEAGQKLLTMIDDTFEVAKGDAGKTELYGQSFYGIDLLGDVLRTAQPILAKRGHALEVRVVGELGKMYIDPSQTRWVLLGLLLYAARKVENSTIALIAIREKAEGMDGIVFEIAEVRPDESMPQAHAEAQSAVQDEEDIGMITAQRFCKELGGNLVIDDGAEGLTKFSVWLPIRPGAEAEPKSPAS